MKGQIVSLANRSACILMEDYHALFSFKHSALAPEFFSWFPETIEVFDRYGLGVIWNPVLRRTVARRLTLAQAAAMHDVPRQEFLHDLNLAVRERPKDAYNDNAAIGVGN